MGVIIGVIAGIAGLGLIFLIAALATRQYKHVVEKEKNLVETSEARYTENQDIVKDDNSTNVSFNNKDIVLSMGVKYKIGLEPGNIKPGKYTILTTEEGIDSFNIRNGRYVKEFHHGDDIVLAKDSEISAVSTNVILR